MLTGKVDVAAAILELGVNGISRKDLQSKIDLPSDLLDEYFHILVSKNLIMAAQNKNGKIESVKTTDRGTKFIELYHSIKMRYLTTSAAKQD